MPTKDLKNDVDNLKDASENDKNLVLKVYRKEVQELKDEIYNNPENLFLKLDFGYKTSEISERGENTIRKINENLENNLNPMDRSLLANLQVQTLIADVIDTQADKFLKGKEQLEQYIATQRSLNNHKEDIGDSETIGVLGTFEEFKNRNYSSDSFEDFIFSEEGISVVKKEIQNHINPETGETYPDYPISEETLRLKLMRQWNTFMLRSYKNVYDEMLGEDTSVYRDEICNIIGDEIDLIIGEHIKNGGDSFSPEIINNLEGLINQIKLLLSDSGEDESIEMIKYIFKLRGDFLSKYLEVLINDFSDLVYKDGNISLETGNTQTNLQLKAYLFIYGKIFIPDLFNASQGKNGYDAIMLELLKAILCQYNPELRTKIKNKKLLEELDKAEREREERERIRREEAEARNRERNNLNTGSSDINRDEDQHSDNSKDNSGVQLVRDSNVNLSDFSVGGEDSESLSKRESLKKKAFDVAWKDFIESYDEIKDIITYPDMLKLYDMEMDRIDNDAWKNFLESDIMKGRTQEEINQIFQMLQAFPNKFSIAMDNITNKIVDRRGKIDNEVKIHALGSVIDNVKDIFDDIVKKWQGDSRFEGFLFNSDEPVKRKGNDIIISGKFNGADIKIRYNLISGELFMNSFIQHLSTFKIKIGNNTDADFKIGQLESFETILDEHYSIPNFPNKTGLGNNSHRNFNHKNNGGEWDQDDIQHQSDEQNPVSSNTNKTPKTNMNNSSLVQSGAPMIFHPSTMGKEELDSIRKKFGDMIDSNLELISTTIINHSKKQSARNSVITKFMKTFNIIADKQIKYNIDVNEGSNMFDFLQIIENSDSASLDTFQVFMEKIMEYSGLKRGSNNLLGSQINQKSELIFNKKNNNKYVSLLRESSKDFSDNLENLKLKLNFDKDSQLGFIKMIIENITDDAKKPNWKFDIPKMDNFIYYLENGSKQII